MHEKFFLEVMRQGEIAASKNEVPIGAVVVQNGEIIGVGYNAREQQNDVFGHAEVMAIKDATNRINSWKLDDCEIYITLEPCLMCYGAIKQSRIKKIFYGLRGQKQESYKNYVSNDDEIEVEFHYYKEMEKEMELFFKKLRKK